LLEPGERECVCGDLQQLQLSTPAAARNILGLVIRRQFAEWSHWSVWIALFGVAGVAGCYLSESVANVDTAIFLQIRTYLTYGVAYEPGGVSLMQQVTYTATVAIAVLLSAWASGFALASLSKRTLLITGFLFYCVVRDSWVIRMTLAGNIVSKHPLGLKTILLSLSPLEPIMIVFLLAVWLGVRSARKGGLKRNTLALLPVIGLSLVLLLAWMETWFAAGFAHWSGQPYIPTPFLYRVLPFLAGAWPVFLIPFFQYRFQPGRSTS
jgi:hypothetical protein